MKVIVFFALFLWMASVAYGGPSPTVQFLMDEPVTLFDWGLFQLKNFIDQLRFEELNLSLVIPHIDYDWDQNRLEIAFRVKTKEPIDKASAVLICKRIKFVVSGAFGAYTSGEMRYALSIGRFFEHSGFESEDKPRDVRGEIERITKIKVTVFARKGKDSPANIKILSCESPLIGGKIIINDK